MIPLKFGLGTLVRLHDSPFKNDALPNSHNDNKLQNTNIFQYCLVGQNKRGAQIAISCQPNAENEHNERLNNTVQNS